MPRRRLSFEYWPAAVYAIGDVHGCLPQLIELERLIGDDAASFKGEKWIVMLGDYVDRGAYSAQVIEHLLQPAPPGFRRVCLMGNHEQMMLDFLDDPATHGYWLDEGGGETLLSYGVDLTSNDGLMHPKGKIPGPHRQALHDMPISLALPGWFFVHAGIRPGLSLLAQSDQDLIWIREPFLNSPLPDGLRIVHGHTPAAQPVITRYRICIDTQCFRTGRLTAVCITPDGGVSFLST